LSLLGLLAVTALSGCPGEPVLDEQVPMSLSIKTPEHEGEIIFSTEDASMLGLKRRAWDIDQGRDRGSTLIPTGLSQSASESTEYCFVESVDIASPSGSERVLIEPGECFGGSATTLDREAVHFTAPPPGSAVGDVLEVRVVDEVGSPDSTVRFFVDGVLTTSEADPMGRAMLDLSGVDEGPFAIRVEIVDPGDWVRAASVIEVVKENPAQ
jgi:hypothetical protein